jgi:hypothetical protein
MILNGMDSMNGARMDMRVPFHGGGLAGIDDGSGEESSALQDITGAIRDLVTSYNQQKILEANIDRAARGLPPINTSLLAPTYNVGLTSDTKNMLIIGGVVLAAILLLNGGRGRR